MAAGKGKQSKFELIIGAVDRFAGTFKKFNDFTDRSAAKVQRLENSVSSLGRAVGLSKLGNAAKNLGERFGSVGREGKALVGTVASLAGKASLLFGAAGGGAFALAKNTANAGDAAAKAAQRAGSGLRTWQEYAYAASLSAVGNEQLEKTFIKLQDMAVKAFQGDKTQKGLLKLAGIDPRTAKGEIKNADSILMELSDKVRELQDAGKGAEATNLLKSILGDEGTKLMPLLRGGAEGLKQMRLEAHRLGLVFSDEDAQAAEEFNREMTRLGGSFRGIGFSLGKSLLPPLTKLSAKFTEWAAENREIIATKFDKWVNGIKIDELWKSIESGVDTLGRLADKAEAVAQFFGGWENVLIGLGALISGKFILSLASLAGAFGKLGLAILATPFGWFALAVAVAAYAIYKNWDNIASYFTQRWEWIKKGFEVNWLEGVVRFLASFNPVNLLTDGMNGLIAWLTGFDLMEIGMDWGRSLWDGFLGWIEAKMADLPDVIKDFLGIGQTAAHPDASGAAMSVSTSPTMGLTGMAQGFAGARTEHVERKENTVTLVPPEGWGMQASGPLGDGVSVSNPNNGPLGRY